MNAYRNLYAGTCVYCHTPHGANSNSAAPLWNRVLPSGASFTTYDKLNTTSLTQTVYNPGAASLVCLSCHDGSQAVDAVFNMPGSGQYSAAANPGLFSVPAAGPLAAGEWGYKRSGQHRGLASTQIGSGAVTANAGCLACHAPGTGFDGVATDFTLFLIGKDLKNDHPIGVAIPPAGPGTDWNAPTGTKVAGPFVNRFYDDNGNSRMEKGDLRLYDTGSGAKVECGSCHDPHGVTNSLTGKFFPTFLRKSIDGSTLCVVCHAK